MADNFQSLRIDIKDMGKEVHTLALRIGTLESETKHLRDDFKWIKGVLIAGIAIGVIIGIVLGGIGGNFRWPG